jgi:uncharacterized phage-associated protein
MLIAEDALKLNYETNLLLFIIHELGGEATFLKVFKIIYFADQKHLVKYGSLVSKDKYIAMKHGPVPSLLYDMVKLLKGEGLLVGKNIELEGCFELSGDYTIKSLKNPDMKLFSKSKLEAVRAAIAENKNLSFNELSVKSHDFAWQQANLNDEIDLLNIARAGGANENMIAYIRDRIENTQAVFEYS